MAKTKKYALTNSYFKNKQHSMPDTILEIAKFRQENGELPFEYRGENWVYDAFVERQKRNGVSRQQFLTPDTTACLIACTALPYQPDNMLVLDACCGTGQLTRALISAGFNVHGFDCDNDLVELCKIQYPDGTFFNVDFREDIIPAQYELIVSNPPYDLKDLQEFLSWLYHKLSDYGTAILLIPKGFIEKERPKALVNVINKFKVVESHMMFEEFARTAIKAEIVVLQKQ